MFVAVAAANPKIDVKHALRARRTRLDEDRSTYEINATKSEEQLTEVEAAVEELRGEVLERRYVFANSFIFIVKSL